MKTKILLFTLSPSVDEEDIDEKIQDLENDGFYVTKTETIAGNTFTKNTAYLTLIVTLQKI